jgi:predicted ester cyclase
VTLLRAFPDLHVAIEDVIAEGDKVVYRNTVTGTFTEGRIAEIWGVVDVLAQLRQLGVVPA